MLFRSGEHVDRWCESTGIARGEVITLEQSWRLAKTWYHDRLDPNWRRKTPGEAMAVFESIGLDSPFWRLE